MKNIPSFTVILLMTVAAVLGLVSLPMLNVQYAPEKTGRTIKVSCSWEGASERVMEAEVISVLEGVLSGIPDCSSISSVSKKGSGTVSVAFRKGTDMAAARFEVAYRIRNAYPKFPDGVSYPSISLGTRGTGAQTALIYVIKSQLPSNEIEKFVAGHLIPAVSAVDGVENVSFWGATPFELEVVFDAERAGSLGISADEIRSAFDSWFGTEMLGMGRMDGHTMGIKLQSRRSSDIGAIPLVNSGGRVVHLRDIAEWRYKESEPASYFRMNGLNTVMLSVEAAGQTNLLRTSADVKSLMNDLKESFPGEITATLTYDSSDYIRSELDRIYLRTFICVLILLLFVLITSRSWRYLLVIASTLAVSILVAIVFYNIFSLPVHIYTLAGITVSLGIIIDSSIVMADHYSYYRNRKVFPALLGATATTVGALCVIALLPEKERLNLQDFSLVIAINLAVALLTAYFFVPSLLDRFPVNRHASGRPYKHLRRAVRRNHLYARYIEWGVKHRWVYLVLLAAAFGLPLFLLPEKVAGDVPEEEQNFFQKSYNSIMSWKPYSRNRRLIDNIAGTSFALFGKAVERSDFYREPGRDVLYVQAGMPEGCSVGQLNEVVKNMENYLSSFDEIGQFTTRVESYDYAMIEINFKPEYENTSFPSELKSSVMSMASNFGGAFWRVWGVNESYFNNQIISNYKSNRIVLRGYNYDELYAYADSLLAKMSENQRVSAPEIMSDSYSVAGTEFNLEYDFEKLSARGVSPYAYFKKLYTSLYDTQLGKMRINGEYTPVVLRSSEKDNMDLWNVLYSQVSVDSLDVKLSEIGSIEKKRTALPIRRKNQSYEITVGYDFIGSFELAERYTDTTVEWLNDKVLPMGYKAENPMQRTWNKTSRMRDMGLILLVIAIIYVMCSITFESVRLPFAVLLMIPLSFIGVFLVFGLSDITFDQGGFAAFVMLIGLVVNAGIYLINAFQNDRSGVDDVRKYIRAFNHKITAILLTVLSTILGLVPFLFDGPEDVFWFAFSAGTICGMVFSIIALLFYLPVFVCRKPRN